METIGGYFELELRKGEHYHKDAIRLNTARNCFEYVLRTRNYVKVYLPYYTCDVMLEPVQKLNIAYGFYHINEKLEPISLPKLNANEAFLYTNYFGLKQDCVERLSERYGERLIVDSAQAFYAEPLNGIDTFYSARKFFGVPDGAYLYTDKPLRQEFEQDCSYERMSHLVKRIDLGAEAGYQDFRKNDESLCGQEIKKMSKLTEAILSGIDYEFARARRRENYLMLEQVLASTNMLHLSIDESEVPMVYPYWVDNGCALKKKLIDNKVFVATYWPNIFKECNSEDCECIIANNVCFLPIDQRYNEEEMKWIIDII
jgi:hypothetical protein